MGFCKFSSSLINETSINVDAKFLNDYLPIVPDNYLKVYLFGLLKCQNSESSDNSIQNFVNVLNLKEEDIINAFKYWQEENLVQIIETNPIQIKFLPQKNNFGSLKKVDSKKYATFVSELQETISGRQINPNEYLKYIDFIENYNIQATDFIMIVKYCVDKKGDNINCNYILTVAKVWVEEGVRTAEKIKEKIESLTLLSSEVNQVAQALKFRGNLSIEHQQFYEKWVKFYGFNLNTILALSKKVSAKSKSFGFEKLDKLLTDYYELKIMSFAEMEDYEQNKTKLKEIAININRELGLYYESVESEITTYIIPWQNKGFDEETLIKIAMFCFKNNIRTLDGMNDTVQRFSKKGLISLNSINNHVNELASIDNSIKQILEKLNLDRRVSSFDRNFYKAWVYTFNFSKEIIDYAISQSIGKNNSMQYANALLTNWYENNLTELSQIKEKNVKVNSDKKDFAKKSFVSRTYSEEEVNALFDDLDTIEL